MQKLYIVSGSWESSPNLVRVAYKVQELRFIITNGNTPSASNSPYAR